MNRPLRTIVWTLVALAAAGNASACEGRDRDITVALVDQLLVSTTRVIETMDLQRWIADLQQFSTRAERLPHSCQMAIKAWSDAMGRRVQAGGGGGGGGPQCMGGVCCDSNNCY